MTPAQAFAALDAAARGAARDRVLGDRRRAAGIRDWTRGGCAVYAEGLRRWLGPEARLVGVREQGDPTIDHVAAVWQGLYFDAHGVRDESDFLFDAETIGLFRIPELVPLVDVAAISLIEFAPELVPAVLRALRARLEPIQAMATLVSKS